MNKTLKHIVAILVGIVLMAGAAQAKGSKASAPVQDPGQVPMLIDLNVNQANAVNFPVNTACYLPDQNLFVVIDSVDCAVDVLVRTDNTIRVAGRFTTDVYQGRHDIKNIVRPKSVMTAGGNVVVLASSQTDSSFIAVFPIEALQSLCGEEIAELQPAALVGFSCSSFAFQMDEGNNELLVFGKNGVGYDINAISFAEGVEQISPSCNFHYHVPKQSERIQESDPYGYGLAIVAIIVVFLALVCICFIMNGYGLAIKKISERKPENKLVAPDGGEIYAAIAAAIHCYEEEQHDAEDTVITIQKVERAWTPWNAKFYNMNQFFVNRK